MSSASGDETNGHPPSENGHGRRSAAAPSPPSAAEVESAIALADIYRGRGTSYLHADDPFLAAPSSSSSDRRPPPPASADPTGAVVPAICLATTFRQSEPGKPAARDDPNSFGMGYEYSRTGEWAPPPRGRGDGLGFVGSSRCSLPPPPPFRMHAFASLL